MRKNSQLRETRITFVWQETGKLALRHAAAEKLGVQGFFYQSPCHRGSCCHDNALQTVGGRKRRQKKGDGDGGWRKNRRNKKLPTLVSEQFMWTVCQVARWIPPGHYRFRRRANREMESVPVISAQTHSAWWAQMRVSKASHVWNEEGGGIPELNQMKGGIQIRECGHPHRSCLWASGWWHRRLNTLKIHQQHLKRWVRF